MVCQSPDNDHISKAFPEDSLISLMFAVDSQLATRVTSRPLPLLGDTALGRHEETRSTASRRKQLRLILDAVLYDLEDKPVSSLHNNGDSFTDYDECAQ
jgi:hypothetical protein